MNPGTGIITVHNSIGEELERCAWIAGKNLTELDIVPGYSLILSEDCIGFVDRFEHIKACLKRMRARPALQAAMEKSGGLTPVGS